MMEWWNAAVRIISDIAGVIAPGVLLSLLSIWSYRILRLRRTLRALFFCFVMHGERIVYVKKLHHKGEKSWGSFEISNLGNLLISYLTMGDRSSKRQQLCIDLYDAVFQIACHMNMPVRDRCEIIRPNNGEKYPAYEVAAAFAIDKLSGYIDNIYDLARNIPPFSIMNWLRKTTKKPTKYVSILEDRLPYKVKFGI